MHNGRQIKTTKSFGIVTHENFTIMALRRFGKDIFQAKNTLIKIPQLKVTYFHILIFSLVKLVHALL